MKRLLFIVSVLLSLHVCAQQDPPATDTTVYTFVDNMPQYPGGPGAMMQYLSANIQYKGSESCGALPRIYMSFVINAKGEVTQPKAAVRYDPVCPELQAFLSSVEKALAGMPDWEPGRRNTVPVNVRLNLPMFICLH
jgi:protein TonB